MSDLNNLKTIFADADLDDQINPDQLRCFFECFKEDFIASPFVHEGKTVKIILQKSRIPGLTEYPETFAHIVTRELKSQNDRFYDSKRANRISWIKPILENKSSKEILVFKSKDDRGVCKEHYWYFKRDFMVVTKDVGSNVLIVTAFCVDGDEKLKFYERYKKFKEGVSDCK